MVAVAVVVADVVVAIVVVKSGSNCQFISNNSTYIQNIIYVCIQKQFVK